jgi:hypothetical protein
MRVTRIRFVAGGCNPPSSLWNGSSNLSARTKSFGRDLQVRGAGSISSQIVQGLNLRLAEQRSKHNRPTKGLCLSEKLVSRMRDFIINIPRW